MEGALPSEDRRTGVLRSTRVLASPDGKNFDRFTRLAVRLLGVSSAFVNLVHDHGPSDECTLGMCQEPWAAVRGTPLTRALCQLAMRQGSAVVVPDARDDAALRENLSIRELGVLAFAGIPLFVRDEAIGAFCALDEKPRRWTEQELHTLHDLAASVVSEIELRLALREAEADVAYHRDVSEKLRQVDVYRTLVRSIPRAAVGLFDRELRCLAIDGGMARGDGALPADMLGRTMRDLAGLTPEDPHFDPIDALYRGVFDGGEGSTDYVDARRGRVLELHVAPVRDAAGRIDAGIVLAIDRTLERRNESELQRSEQINRELVRHLPNGAVFMVDRDLRFVAADGPILPEVLRRGKLDTLIGRTVNEVVAPENLDETLEVYRSVFEGKAVRREMRRRGRFMEVSAVPVFAAGGDISHAIAFLYDVTDRKVEAEELRQTRDLLARERTLLSTTLEHIADGVVLLDSERRIILANAAYADMLCLSREQLEGLTRLQFVTHLGTLLDDPGEALERFVTQGEVAEDFVFTRPRRRILRRLETPVQLPAGGAFLVTWRDVTAERDLLAERERQLTVDGLTGIANRRAAEAVLQVEDARRTRAGGRFAVALIDIDHFKKVNDRHGHATGDEVLRSVAETLSAQARVTDLVARWGGEEFLAVLPGPLSGALAFAERARAAVERTASSKGDRVTVSVGVAEVGPDELPSVAIERADDRLYDAKRQGRNRVVA